MTDVIHRCVKCNATATGTVPASNGSKDAVCDACRVNTPSHLTEDGKIRIRLTSERFARYPEGQVLDCFGQVIGDATSYTYGGTAFAVHTKPFAGHVPFRACVFVGGTRGIIQEATR